MREYTSFGTRSGAFAVGAVLVGALLLLLPFLPMVRVLRDGLEDGDDCEPMHTNRHDVDVVVGLRWVSMRNSLRRMRNLSE
jgi:hypothetical protein